MSWELGTPEKKPGTGPYREMMKDGCAEQWEGPILDSRAEGFWERIMDRSLFQKVAMSGRFFSRVIAGV